MWWQNSRSDRISIKAHRRRFAMTIFSDISGFYLTKNQFFPARNSELPVRIWLRLKNKILATMVRTEKRHKQKKIFRNPSDCFYCWIFIFNISCCSVQCSPCFVKKICGKVALYFVACTALLCLLNFSFCRGKTRLLSQLFSYNYKTLLPYYRANIPTSSTSTRTTLHKAVQSMTTTLEAMKGENVQATSEASKQIFRRSRPLEKLLMRPKRMKKKKSSVMFDPSRSSSRSPWSSTRPCLTNDRIPAEKMWFMTPYK